MKYELAARHPSNSGARSKKKVSPSQLLIEFGPIVAFATWIARRPVIFGAFAAFAAAILVSLSQLGYFRQGATGALSSESAAHARTQQTPPPPAEPQSVQQIPVVALAPPPSPARDIKTATIPARAAAAKPIVTERDPALENWLVASYLKCWSPPANLPKGEPYGAQIRVVHKADGSLAAAPRLVNPPMDPEWRPYADSALRAVTKCNPLHVPPQYVAQFDQWKKLTLHF
jgi:hypothetical protein